MPPPARLMFGKLRRQGFFDTMAANGLEVNPDWVVDGDMTQRGGAEVAEKLLNSPDQPTAIICGNDLMAMGTIKRVQQHGLRIGHDIAVSGFDDIPIATYVNPSLTTVHQPIYEIGRKTCAMLIDIINGRTPAKAQQLLTPTLIIRDSSGPPRT